MGSGGGGVLFVEPRAAGQPCLGVSVAPVVDVVSCCLFVCCCEYVVPVLLRGVVVA